MVGEGTSYSEHYEIVTYNKHYMIHAINTIDITFKSYACCGSRIPRQSP